MKLGVEFVIEDVELNLEDREKLTSWIINVVSIHNKTIDQLTYIFCSDDYLLKINKEYLDHDYYTDIITFPYSYDELSADMFISIDRIIDNAERLKVPFTKELHRVMIHGILHLLGYDDKLEEDQKVMRQKEDDYIALL